MRTIATLNLPATTSGTWSAAALSPLAEPAAQSLVAGPLAFGVELHAPTTMTVAANKLTSRSRVLAMDPPPHRRADDAPALVALWIAPAPQTRACSDGPRGVPAARSGRRIARPGPAPTPDPHDRTGIPDLPPPGRPLAPRPVAGSARSAGPADRGAPGRLGRARPVPSRTMFERTALAGGPRVISATMPGARSVSIAAYVLAGSRLETPEEAGVAHFMEHITFKGTERFPSTRAISEAIEGVGGSFNAATDRESTVYWVRVPRREATPAMDVLGELIVRPNLDEKEIDGERTVIIEEIRSYLGYPAEYAQTLFQQAMFGSGPLGREICAD